MAAHTDTHTGTHTHTHTHIYMHTRMHTCTHGHKLAGTPHIHTRLTRAHAHTASNAQIKAPYGTLRSDYTCSCNGTLAQQTLRDHHLFSNIALCITVNALSDMCTAHLFLNTTLDGNYHGALKLRLYLAT